MNIKKLILIFIIIINLNANDVKLYLNNTNVKNGQTALLTLEAKSIKEAKLTFDKHNINFYSHPIKKNYFYALIPISYYKKQGKYKIIVSYKKNKKKIFKGISINVVEGDYKSEVINVAKGKVSLSKKNKERTKKEYEHAIKIYNTISKELYIAKKFVYPIKSKITSSYGNKRLYNGKLKSYHGGTDFKANIGTNIKAINDGIISISENRFYAGNSIVINHGQGIYSCYYHLSKMNYKVGQKVKKNQKIGLSGSTGRVTGPHLHFAIRVNGIQVDPLQLLSLLNNNLLY